MTKQDHSQQDLIQYLLGSLPDSESERFDALSVSDAEFADELSAAENDLVDAYIQGGLSGETLARFEAHYLASPLRREKVEFARAFQTYGEGQVPEPAPAATKREPATAGFFTWLGLITNQTAAVRWSLAFAASVLLAAGAWWIFQGGGNPSVASFVLTPPLRGEDQITTLSIPRRTTEVRIQLQLESDDYPSYRVALKEDAAATELWDTATLTASGKGEGKVLEVRVPAKLLKSKIYSLVVTGIGRDGTTELVSDYPFRMEMK
jgi:hypothetical protein